MECQSCEVSLNVDKPAALAGLAGRTCLTNIIPAVKLSALIVGSKLGQFIRMRARSLIRSIDPNRCRETAEIDGRHN